VLHAEDTPFVRLAFEMRAFKPLGLQYVQVADGRAAIETLSASAVPFDCVVLDNQMPELGGAATARALRARGFDGLIIGATGDPVGCDDRDDFEASGVDVCLDKDSAGLEQLVERIRAHASRLPSPGDGEAGESPSPRAGGRSPPPRGARRTLESLGGSAAPGDFDYRRARPDSEA
jgi:CheY-like chemotaxis protein